MGLKSLTRSELETTLLEVEGWMNSRPLTFVGDNVSDRSPLTPLQFLIGRSHIHEEQNESNEKNVTSSDLIERKLFRKCLDGEAERNSEVEDRSTPKQGFTEANI